MRFIAHRMNAARIDPSVVKIEKRADRQRVIDRLIRVPGFVQRGNIRRSDVHGVVIDFPDKTEKRLFLIRKSGRLRIPYHGINQFLIIQQFRRDRGVRLQSKRAVIQR